MELTYEQAIEAMLLTAGDPSGKCAEWTDAFAHVFPELKRIRGFVTLRSGLRRSHWWLETPDGKIVDPTASQFDMEYFWHAGIAFYEPFNETDPEPTGKCPNCGEFCYDGGTCCTRKCNEEYAAYLNDPKRRTVVI